MDDPNPRIQSEFKALIVIKMNLRCPQTKMRNAGDVPLGTKQDQDLNWETDKEGERERERERERESLNVRYKWKN